MTQSITKVRSKIDAILTEGIMDTAVTTLQRLIQELHPWIEHLPSFETIERHLTELTMNRAVVPGPTHSNPQAEEKKRDAQGARDANARSRKAINIIRGYIRCREALKNAGKEDLPAHIEAVAALKRNKQFDNVWVDAIFHP